MTTTSKKLSKTLALLAATAAFASSGWAATITLSLNEGSNGNGLGGGSYTASGSGLSTAGYAAISHPGSAAAGTFQTFCLEYSEHFTPGTVYNYSIGNAATLGGVSGATNGADPISLGTAWLYSQFAAGSLAGYDYGAGRKASNTSLQLAIWFLENETSGISGYSSYGTPGQNVFLDAAFAKFGSASSARADANGAYGVQVLNLTKGQTHAQSQLYASAPIRVPDTGATVVLFGLTLAGLLGIKRKLARTT
ncbi:MAG TPA: VPDSG-CTERM sorting domain-containing protein [Opitutaceae bacterium]|nr:VPDSG-CTERM sorting domain-containing protein [Opitutaceae bacterium]